MYKNAFSARARFRTPLGGAHDAAQTPSHSVPSAPRFSRLRLNYRLSDTSLTPSLKVIPCEYFDEPYRLNLDSVAIFVADCICLSTLHARSSEPRKLTEVAKNSEQDNVGSRSLKVIEFGTNRTDDYATSY